MEGEYKTLVAPSIPIHVITGGANRKAKLDEGTGIAGIASDQKLFLAQIFSISKAAQAELGHRIHIYTPSMVWMLNAIPVMGLVGLGCMTEERPA